MTNFIINKLPLILITAVLTSLLTACVTQNYHHDKNTPIVENSSSATEKAMTRISLALGYLRIGNTQQAKFNLEKAKDFAPNLVPLYIAFAHYYEAVEEPKLTVEAYEKALSINAQDPDVLNNYGVFLCRQGKYLTAEKLLLKAIAIPSYTLVAQSYENLALCQLKAKQFDNAQNYLEKAINHSPHQASSLLHMVRLQYAKGNYKLAQNYLHRYELSSREYTAQALALAFKVYEKQESKHLAKKYGTMLVNMFPKSFEADQYILNELYQIEADQLATAYQMFMQNKLTKMKSKKDKT